MKIKTERWDFNAGTDKKLKFAVFSDLHNCDNEPLTEILFSENPDAILLPGDYIHNDRIYERGFEFLKICTGYRPSFCSIGNHERKYSGDLKGILGNIGVVLLDNGYTDFCGVKLGGLSSGFKGAADQQTFTATPMPETDWLDEYEKSEGFHILLSHHPEYYEPIVKNRKIELTVSGHAHGGQWRLFGRGAFAPGQGVFPKYTSGLYEKRLLVSRGLGNPHDIPRINNTPEVIIITLNP